jgi:hypothetical protein
MTLFQNPTLGRLTDAHLSQEFAHLGTSTVSGITCTSRALKRWKRCGARGLDWIGHDGQGTPQSGHKSRVQS